MVTEDELAQIQRRMAEAGITNAGAYMRKMALNGYILHVDLAPVKELVSLQRRCANNLFVTRVFIEYRFQEFQRSFVSLVTLKDSSPLCLIERFFRIIIDPLSRIFLEFIVFSE